MAIWCKHDHRLELTNILNFYAAHLQIKRYKDEIRVFLILDMHVRNKKYLIFAWFLVCLCRFYVPNKKEKIRWCLL